jgi:four helix bundle protein
MGNSEIHSYKDLIVWQKAMDLVIAIYELTEQYPKEEKYGLVFDTRKTSRSIPYNIAEGRRRSTQKDYWHFLIISYASGGELETQIEIAKRLPWSNNLSFDKVDSLLLEVMKMLNKMTNSLKS